MNMSLLNIRHGANRTLLLIAVVAIVGLFLYFGGASQLGITRGGRGLDFGGGAPFGGGWLPLLVAAGIGFVLGWAVSRRR